MNLVLFLQFIRDHNLAIDQPALDSPIDVESALESSKVLKFAINKSGRVVNVEETGDRDLTRAIYQGNYKAVCDKLPLFVDERIANAIKNSGNFSADEVAYLLKDPFE